MSRNINIKIEHDSDAESPRGWSNIGYMICFHRRYHLGDGHTYGTCDAESWEDLGHYLEAAEDAVVIMPLYLYDHSGITISTSPFSCPWDSGQVGFILARRCDVLKEWGRKRMSAKLLEQVRQCLLAEVEVYDKYLRGDTWGYIIEDESGEQLDSCWGFFGREAAEEAAEEARPS